jgi:glycosyltransferase involved in cell wall biosynthesis
MERKIHPWQEDPIITQSRLGDQKPIWTLVMPFYNQRENIKPILELIMTHAALPFDLIFIDDASNDESSAVILDTISSCDPAQRSKLCTATFIRNNVPIYETACDNQGFKRARTEFIIEIQADLQIREIAFDRKMIEAMNYCDLGAVSGRHVHDYSLLVGRKGWFRFPISLLVKRLFRWGYGEGVGRLGKLIFTPEVNCDPGIYIGETVARGPWLLKKSDLDKLNYLDEDSFFLGNDDHDYHRRLFTELGKSVGYLPLLIYSDPEAGSTRKVRVGINKEIFEYLSNSKKGSIGFLSFLKSYRPYKSIKRINFIIP